MKKILTHLLLGLACAGLGVTALAKLPPPSEEAKAKAEDAKTKAADAAKKDGEMLGKSQDGVAERYIKEQKAKGVMVKPTPIAVAAPAPATAPAPAPKKQ